MMARLLTTLLWALLAVALAATAAAQPPAAEDIPEDPPAELAETLPDGLPAEVQQEAAAQWHLNYAGFLIDVGKYMQAYSHYQTAFDLSERAATKAKVRLAEAQLLAAFLDEQDKALDLYGDIAAQYPQVRETAIFRRGFLLKELGRKAEAREALQGYLRDFPDGRFRVQAEALLPVLETLPDVPPEPKLLEIPRPTMRVKLGRTASSLTLSAGEAEVCLEGGGCAKEMRLAMNGEQLTVNGQPRDKKTMLFASGSPITVRSGGYSKTVRGKVRVTPQRTKMLAVNLIDMESYLRSVVPAESFASWPQNTLKAQTVAARTYALYQAQHRQKRSFDVVDNAGDQAYGGVERERKSTDKAVAATRGEILAHGGKPILAMYTANSGGVTAQAKAVFNVDKPYLRSRKDPDSLKGQLARWTRKFAESQVKQGLRRVRINLDALDAITPAQRGPSGRVVRVQLKPGGTKDYRTFSTLRRALKLPDILFEVRKEGDTFVFEGGGHGHGVGYSQWGGAEQGKTKDYRDILEFYYPGTQLVKAW